MKRNAAPGLFLLVALCVSGCSSSGSSGSGSSDSSKPSASDKAGGQNKNGNAQKNKNQSGGGKQGGSSDTTGQSGGSGGSQSGGSNSGSGSDRMGGTTAFKVTGEQQARAGIKVALIDASQVQRTVSAPAQVMMNEEHTAHVAPIVDGYVTAIIAQPGNTVRRGEVMARVHSHIIHETIGVIEQDLADIARRQAAIIFEQQRAERYAHLYSIQAASLEESQRAQQSLLQAKNDLAVSEVSLHTEREHLADVLQVAPSSITPAELPGFEDVPIKAAISGTVVSRTIAPGMVLQPGMEAFTVSNLDTVWVVASVNEADLSHVRRGDTVQVRTSAWPNEVFRGRVTLVGSVLDPATRTIQVRATIPNPGGRLKSAMFATAEIGGGDTRQAIYVPEEALQDINGVESVFTTDDGITFNAQAVKVGRPVGHQVEVLEGLKAGQHVAVAATFMLKSELLKSSVGGD